MAGTTILILVLLAFVVLIGVAIAGTAWSASRREWRFEFSSVFTHTFDAIGRAPAVMLGVPLLVEAIAMTVARGAPGDVFGIVRAGMYDYGAGGGTPLATRLLMLVMTFVLRVFGQLVLCGCATYALEGHERPQTTALACAFPAFLPAILLTLLEALVLVFGFLLLVVPGAILSMMWIVAIPVLARERTGVLGSLSRSADLTQGARWPIFLLVILFFTITMIAGGGVGLLQAPLGRIGGLVALAAINALVMAVSNAGAASIYHQLRVQKEGVQTGELETVFA